MKRGPSSHTTGDSPPPTSSARDDLFWYRTVRDLGADPDAEATTATPPHSTQKGTEPWADSVRIGLALAASSALLAALTLALRSGLVRVARELPAFLGSKPLKFYVALAHILALGLILTLLVTKVSSRAPESPVAQRAFRQFERGWNALWASWLGLYVWLALAWGEAFASGSPWVMAIADLFNISSSGIFLYLFLVLDRPSVKATGEPARDRAFRTSLFGVVSISGAVGIASVLGRFELFHAGEFGPMLGSILAAISMAFFFGRLSDSHMKIRRALLAPLYLYVAIQMLWHLFQQDTAGSEVAHSLVFCGALLLKVYLFAVVTRWIATGTLQTYFDEVAFPRLAADLEEL